MWVFVTFVYSTPAVAATIKILSPSGACRQQELPNEGVPSSPHISTELA